MAGFLEVAALVLGILAFLSAGSQGSSGLAGVGVSLLAARLIWL